MSNSAELSVSAVVDLLRSGSTREQINAAEEVRLRCQKEGGSSQAGFEFARAGAIDALIALLEETESEEGKISAVKAMSNLAENNDANKLAISQAGGLEALADCLLSGTAVSNDAVQALLVLGVDPDQSIEDLIQPFDSCVRCKVYR